MTEIVRPQPSISHSFTQFFSFSKENQLKEIENTVQSKEETLLKELKSVCRK